jgi:hypothetical protein
MKLLEITGSHGVEYEKTVFWDMGPSNVVEADRRFRHVHCLRHQSVEQLFIFKIKVVRNAFVAICHVAINIKWRLESNDFQLVKKLSVSSI